MAMESLSISCEMAWDHSTPIFEIGDLPFISGHVSLASNGLQQLNQMETNCRPLTCVALKEKLQCFTIDSHVSRELHNTAAAAWMGHQQHSFKTNQQLPIKLAEAVDIPCSDVRFRRAAEFDDWRSMCNYLCSTCDLHNVMSPHPLRIWVNDLK